MKVPVARYLPFLLTLLLLGNAVTSFAQTSTPPNVADALVLRVNGNATVTTAEAPQSPVPLRNRMKLREGAQIQTGADSSVSLVFSNGSNVTIGADSRVELRQLFQESFDRTEGTYGSLPGDPSRSETEIFVHQGDVLGEVRGLQSVSRFDVTSAVGTAGIRGTIFQVTINVVDGGIQMIVQNIQGTIIFESTQLSIPETPIPPQNGTEVIARFDDQTGELTIVQSNSVEVPVGRVIQLRTQAQQVTNEATEDPVETGPDSANNAGGSDEESGDETSDSSTSTPERNTSPPVDAQSIIDAVFSETDNIDQEIKVGTSTTSE
jgi:hypothetical protein